GRRVVEVPVVVHEKRKPTINLVRRVPNVIKNIGKLVYAIRIKGA
ncbi:MAG TPA: glycosyl transferase family 2, partial [Myxococcales bacterium]|nr:glycosyl transferase family 2 [Myxococcales bacterium]